MKRNQFPPFVWALSLLLWVGLLPMPSWSGACMGDSLSYRFLKEEVGVFNSTSRVTVLLPCDTMIVEAGTMTTIYPNTLLHFGSRVSENCAIHVRGQLYAKAGRTAKIIFAGDIDSSEFGIVSGTSLWGGLYVDTLGSVYFQNVEVKNASTAMIFMGRNSRLEKVGFMGSYGLILPGGHNFPLDPKGAFYTSFDILNPPKPLEIKKPVADDLPETGTHSATRTTPSPSPKSSSASTWVWSSVAAGALIAGGATAYLYWPPSETPDPPPDEKPQPDAFNDLPGSPKVLGR